jgi:hypothetical protein
MTKILQIIEDNKLKSRKALDSLRPVTDEDIQDLLRDLEHKKSLESIERDPYWPKWDSPWWKMALLLEMGLGRRIPRNVAELLLEKMDKQCLHFFSLKVEEIPPGCDPYRGIQCHCALGTIYRIFFEAGIPVDERLSWVRKWFLKYQMLDGSFNCDEAAYLKENPSGSFLSTLPPLEAVLFCSPGGFTREEENFLNRGADYLIKRKLCRSIRKNMEVADSSWFLPVFPRFYDYDILRGISFLTSWSLAMKKPLPVESIEESLQAIANLLDEEGRLSPGRNTLAKNRTLYPDADSKWSFSGQAALFPLLKKVSVAGEPSYYLTKEWYDNIERLDKMNELNLLA